MGGRPFVYTPPQGSADPTRRVLFEQREPGQWLPFNAQDPRRRLGVLLTKPNTKKEITDNA